MVHGSLAMVWTHYDFWVGGRREPCIEDTGGHRRGSGSRDPCSTPKPTPRSTIGIDAGRRKGGPSAARTSVTIQEPTRGHGRIRYPRSCPGSQGRCRVWACRWSLPHPVETCSSAVRRSFHSRASGMTSWIARAPGRPRSNSLRAMRSLDLERTSSIPWRWTSSISSGSVRIPGRWTDRRHPPPATADTSLDRCRHRTPSTGTRPFRLRRARAHRESPGLRVATAPIEPSLPAPSLA